VRLLIVFLGILVLSNLPAQEHGSLDWDIDSIFDEPLRESGDDPSEEEPKTDTAGSTVLQAIQQRGFTFSASYGFQAGISNGWNNTPWDSEWDKHTYHLDRGIKMSNSIGIDAKISDIFRVVSSFSFQIPVFGFSLGDFFFDYNLGDKVFFRGGKYGLSWGISPNYHFTNLLARVPKDIYSGDSFIFKADIPIGNGGLQVLAMTRANLISSAPLIKKEEIGFGGKYDLALRRADFSVGAFYQAGMPLRGFLSNRTTILDTLLYNEWLLAVDVDDPTDINGAVNIGFGREFFNRKLAIGGELFYNAEEETYWYHPETPIKEAGSSLFVEGFNMALSLLYRPWDKGNPRFSTGAVYSPMQDSGKLSFGFALAPLPSIDLSFGVSMVLGSKEGYYYMNADKDPKGRPMAFMVALLLSLGGGVQFGHYY